MTNTNLSADVQAFADAFFLHRSINREFYQRISEDQYDFRMVQTPTRISDSPRESLAHQINVQKTYILGIRTGKLTFGAHYDTSLKQKSKEELLAILDAADVELKEILAKEELVHKMVAVPWNLKGVVAIAMLWSLHNHEILHTGWNLAIMDHLNMERFPQLTSVWG